MENFTHTLFGLSLAKAGLERITPRATATLLVSSNLPDIDSLTRFLGPSVHLQHHRGVTHSFVGLVILATGMMLAMVFIDRRFRLRRDPFQRPVRPSRIFLLAYLGGLGHLFMDFTNSYGVRPLLPFDDRWFYGDLVFVVDPWIWLILGFGVVLLTARSRARLFFWLIVGTMLGLIVALSLRGPANSPELAQALTISDGVRITWFVGLALIVLGGVFRLGRRGPRLAHYSLVALAVYYGSMWLMHQAALDRVRTNPPFSSTDMAMNSLSAWPAPADPFLWQVVARTGNRLSAGKLDMRGPVLDWREVTVVDSYLEEAIRKSPEGEVFLEFARYISGTVEERDQSFVVILHDLRFPLRLMAQLDRDMAVQSVDLRWY